MEPFGDLTAVEAETHLMVEDGTDPNIAAFVDFAEAYPVPLARETKCEIFPVYALPKLMGQYVCAVAESTQTDPGMIGTAVLSALSGALGGFVQVQVKPDYFEPTNIWTVSVAPPGERKSAVVRAATGPLYDAERDLANEMAPVISERQTQQEIAEKAAERAKRDAGNAPDFEKRVKLTADATTLAAQAQAMKVEAMPRIVGDDATIEALVSHLAEQRGRFALISAEGGFFTTLAGRYSAQTDISPVLSAHAGDRIRVDRKGRASEFVDDPALTVGIMVQPGILSAATGNSTFVDSGLMARFMYAWPPSQVGKRNVDPEPVPGALAKQYHDALYSLAYEARKCGTTRTLTLSPEAQGARLAYAQQVEDELAPGGALSHMQGWASKAVGAAVRMAGLIHASTSDTDVVPGDAMDSAILLMRYYTAHATKVFDGLSAGATDRALARQVMELVRRREMKEFGLRDLLAVANRGLLPNSEAANPVLDMLVEFGWLFRMEPKRKAGPGRPPAPRYRVHPSVWEPETPQQYQHKQQNPIPRDSAVFAEAATAA